MTDSSVKAEFDSLRADFTQLRADLANLTKAIADLTAQKATDRFGDLKQAGEKVQQRLHKAVDDADSLRHSGVNALEQQINEHPLTTIALAFSVGLLIGTAARR